MLTARDLQALEGKPRIQDLKLAERLGFAQPYVIRKLIERNKERLSKRGEVFAMVAKTSDAGGRPGTEYWLTKWQAIKICMWSEAPNADAVQDEIADVFDAYTDGKLVVPGQAPITADVLGQMFEIRKTVERTHEIVEGTDGKVTQLVRSSSRIEQRLQDVIPTKDFSEKTKRIYRYTTAKAFGGCCPCGCKNKIVDDRGNPLFDQHGNSLLNYDHWSSRERNGIESGWPVYRDCNQLLRDDDYRRSKHSRFVVFHEERKTVQGDLREPLKSKPPSRKKRCKLTVDFFSER